MSEMGIELPAWIITTASGLKFWDKESNSITNQLDEDCLFLSKKAAEDKLKDMDFGYVIKNVYKYQDINGVKIRFR